MNSPTTTPQRRPAWAGVKPTALLAVLGLLAFGTASMTAGPNPNPNIAPINSKPHGKTYAQWAAEWQKWVLGIPAEENPLADATGENSDEGQDDPVWFLAGNFGGTTVRDIFVPEGKSVFFPVANAYYFKTEPDEPTDPIAIRDLLRSFLVGATYSCEIDGRPVQNLQQYFTESPIFATTLPADNLFGIDPGSYAPSMNSGWYLMLDPLKRGQHTIHFSATIPAFSFSFDVTYHINVGKPAHVVPPNKRYRGKSYSEWSAKATKMSLELPLEGHPALDTNVVFNASNGQHGNVWFLGSPFDTHERFVTIPAGKALFFILLNAECSSLEPLDSGFHGDTAAEQRDCAKGWADHIVNPFFVIDNEDAEPIADFRVSSPQFAFTAPTPWLFGATGGTGTSVVDGYYVMLRPLGKGAHTIHFGGSFHFTLAEDGFDADLPLDMTYHVISK